MAKSSLEAINGLNADADYEVKGANGTATITMNGGEDARDVAKAFNLVTGSTGVTATAVTRAKISGLSVTESHYSFKLQGRDQNASVVNATISNINDLTTLKDSINSVASDTGIIADLVNNNSSILLIQNEGFDIIIGDLTTKGISQMTVKAVNKNDIGELIDDTTTRTLEGSNNNNDSSSNSWPSDLIK